MMVDVQRVGQFRREVSCDGTGVIGTVICQEHDGVRHNGSARQCAQARCHSTGFVFRGEPLGNDDTADFRVGPTASPLRMSGYTPL
jgi:hypothetical protein